MRLRDGPARLTTLRDEARMIPSRFPREITESDRLDCQCVRGRNRGLSRKVEGCRDERCARLLGAWPNPTGNSITSEVDSSHVIVVSQPQAVTDVILERVTSNRQAEPPKTIDAFGGRVR
jgi:hypothetical protein